MARKKDFSTFEETSGINSFLSEETRKSSVPPAEVSAPMPSTPITENSHDVHDGKWNEQDEESLQPKRGRPRQYTNSLGESVNRSEKITIYLTSEQNQMIDYIARIRGVSKSKLLTDIVDKEMKTDEYRRAYEAMRVLQAQL